MDPALLGSLIQASTGGLGSISNMLLNKQNQKYQAKMYHIQREDSIKDWNMQNAYNSPQAQMMRLKQAGLNPNLVYGQGAVANSSSMPDATPNRNYTPISLDIDKIGDSVGTYFNIKSKQQEMSNLEAQEAYVRQKTKSEFYNTILKILYGDKTKVDIENLKKQGEIKSNQIRTGTLEYELKQDMFEDLKTQLKNSIKLTDAQFQSTIDSNKRANDMHIGNLSMQTIEILGMKLGNNKTKQEIINLQKDGKIKEFDARLKELEIKLNEKGIMKNDPLYSRIISRAIDWLLNQSGSVDEFLKKESVKSGLQDRGPKY